MLAFLFACCGVRKHDSPDERTPLIPHSLVTPSPQPPVIDHQKLKDRLGNVVRAKEGKMVNVNAHFPFHLHAHDHSPPCSSRNVSGSTLSNGRPASPSPARLQKSASAASLRPDEDAPHCLPLVTNPSAPILNVRLVKSARPMQSTRGRSQRSGDPNGRPQVELAPHELHAPPTSPTHHSEAPPYPEDFKIHDAGAVARSWGD